MKTLSRREGIHKLTSGTFERIETPPLAKALHQPDPSDERSLPDSGVHPSTEPRWQPQRARRTIISRAAAMCRLREHGLGPSERERLDAVERVLQSSGAFTMCDPGELAQRAGERVAVYAAAKNVDLDIRCRVERVWVQPRAFGEALFELLDNAVRASPRGFPVFVDVRQTREGDVLWRIADVGEGMSPPALVRLRSGWHPGRGFGVALAWAMVDEHGGLLHIDSTPGAGTLASIWLPAAR